MIAVLATLLTVGVIAPAATPPRAEEFRTEAAPRINPVFDDVASLRHVIDQFFALHADMERVRDEFSGAVHDTFAALGPIGGRPPQICPAELAPLYARASEQGRRFWRWGDGWRGVAGNSASRRPRRHRRSHPRLPHQSEEGSRAHLALVRDYREMRVAYYDQLGAEMHHAGCKPPAAVADGSGEAGRGRGGRVAPANESDRIPRTPATGCSILPTRNSMGQPAAYRQRWSAPRCPSRRPPAKARPSGSRSTTHAAPTPPPSPSMASRR